MMKRLENYLRRFTNNVDRSGPNQYILNMTTTTTPDSLRLQSIVYQIREVTPYGENSFKIKLSLSPNRKPNPPEIITSGAAADEALMNEFLRMGMRSSDSWNSLIRD